MKTREEEIYILANGYYYKATKRTNNGEEIVGIGGRSLEQLVQGNKELIKESFEVKINKPDSGSFYIVKVKSNKTGEFKEDISVIFPKITAKRLRKEIIKERKNKSYKKEFTI